MKDKKHPITSHPPPIQPICLPTPEICRLDSVSDSLASPLRSRAMSDVAVSRGRDLERRTALLPGDLSPTEKLAQLEGFLLQGTEVLEKEAGKQPGKKDMYGTELGLRLNHEKSLNIGQKRLMQWNLDLF